MLAISEQLKGHFARKKENKYIDKAISHSNEGTQEGARW
jgi:hypothetical protein